MPGGRWPCDLLAHQPQEVLARQLARAERGQVGRVLLAVYGFDVPALAGGDQRGERNLGGIAAPAEHRFAEHHPAQVDAVEPAREFAELELKVEALR